MQNCFILLSSIQVCVIIEGSYLLQVELFGYSNPTGRCMECQIIGLNLIGCCDQQLTNLLPCLGVLRCDSYFSYCLRPIGSEGDSCSYFGSRMSTANRDDEHVDFTQNTVLGLENPLQLQGLTANYAVRIYRYLKRDYLAT